MASIPCKTNPMGKSKEPYFSLVVKPGILGGMEYGFTPYWNSGGYCKVLDWGDGIAEDAVTSGTVLSHTYSVAGTYKIKIVANCYKVNFAVSADYAKLIFDSNLFYNYLGALTDCREMFRGASYAEFVVKNLPISLVNAQNMFSNCGSIGCDLMYFPDSLTNCVWMFGSCGNTTFKNLKNLPLGTSNYTGTFYQNTKAEFTISSIPDNVVRLTNAFTACKLARIHLEKLPPGLLTCDETFSGCELAEINISKLAENAPAEGWVNLTSIRGLFYNCPKVTGSRSAFLAKCPNVTNTTNAFTGTNTTE